MKLKGVQGLKAGRFRFSASSSVSTTYELRMQRESPWELGLVVVVQFEFSTKSRSVQNEFEKLDIFTVGAEYLYINNQNVRQCKEFTKITFYLEVWAR